MPSCPSGESGKGQSSRSNQRRRRHKGTSYTDATSKSAKKILLLHGSRQTGGILLGRLERLKKRLRTELQIEIIAPDAPFPVEDNSLLLTWWSRRENEYQGLEKTLELLKMTPWNDENIIGIMGFSQGARLTHLLARLREEDQSWYPNLQFVILVAGYHAPTPDGLELRQSTSSLGVRSLHVWGVADPLITPSQSEKLLVEYKNPHTYVHEGKHFVPTNAPGVQQFIQFIQESIAKDVSKVLTDPTSSEVPLGSATPKSDHRAPVETASLSPIIPDEETAILQQDEIEALQAIFPDEILIQSGMHSMSDGTIVFDFPIVYHMKLLPTDEITSDTRWPIHPLTLEIRYPYNYPIEAVPFFSLLHGNNNFEFPNFRVEKVISILTDTSEMELGQASVLSSIYALKEYLDAPPADGEERIQNPMLATLPSAGYKAFNEEKASADSGDAHSGLIPLSSPERIKKCNLEGLEIAERILKAASPRNATSSLSPRASKKSGGSSWTYVIGLVGKPSAGKSTFFNAATAFARQRSNAGGDSSRDAGGGDSACGGASMAAHPFTTIDPNLGFSMVPAPRGSCPEDSTPNPAAYASTHGRSPDGRRFLPVLLKDVAGLIPGSYLGRGRGNMFLNDLTDATVLIHVVDASGTADAQGNKTLADNDQSELTNPLDDLSWIRNELVEWVYSNVAAKWDAIRRKGRAKLAGMFSGYGQRESEVQMMLVALEHFLDDQYQRDHALDNLAEWDQGDVHRLVSCFLGVRFPMALALNKCDLDTGLVFAREIQTALPIHGAHVGTPMAAKEEMLFVRKQIRKERVVDTKHSLSPPINVWNCLTSSLILREPVLVFPVSDFTTYASLSGLSRVAAESPSLPSLGMIGVILAAGGSVPTCWDASQKTYVVPSKEQATNQKLRDVLVMKPGSTVEDLFFALKRLGGLSGEFVRAEAAGEIGEKPKQVPKLELLGRRNRIIRIMSNKRAVWQN